MSAPRKTARDRVPMGLRVAAVWSGVLLLIGLGVSVLFWGISKLGLATVSFVTGVMVAALLQPLVSWLVRRGLPRGLAAVVAFLVGLGGLGLMVWFVAWQVVDSSGEFGRQLSGAERGARHWLVHGPVHLDTASADRYTVDLDSTISDHTGDLAALVGSHVGAFTGAVSGFVLTLFCVLFLLADDGGMYRGVVRLLPHYMHGYAELAGAAGWRTLVVYMRSLVLLAVLNAAAMLPIMWFADVPLAIPLTVVIFLGSLIPLVGPLVAAALLFALAFIGDGLVTALVVVVAFAVIIQVFGNVINPIILGKFVALHPLVILLGVTAGTILAGPFGAFTAVPLIAVVNNMVKVVVHRRAVLAAEHRNQAEGLSEAELESLAEESL